MAPPQARNPLHRITLEMMLNGLVVHFGWDELGQQVESLYLFMLRERARAARQTDDNV